MPRGRPKMRGRRGWGKKRRGRPPGRPATLSVGAQRAVGELNRYHNELSGRIAALEAEQAAIAGALQVLSTRGGRAKTKAKGKRKGRAGRPPGSKSVARRGPRPEGKSLRDFVLKVVKPSTPMSVKNIASAVKSAGYQTSSSNLPNQVSMLLATMVKQRQVRKLRRGQYAAA